MLKGPDKTNKPPASPTFDSNDWSVLAEIQREEMTSEASPQAPSVPDMPNDWDSSDKIAAEYGYEVPAGQPEQSAEVAKPSETIETEPKAMPAEQEPTLETVSRQEARAKLGRWARTKLSFKEFFVKSSIARETHENNAENAEAAYRLTNLNRGLDALQRKRQRIIDNADKATHPLVRQRRMSKLGDVDTKIATRQNSIAAIQESQERQNSSTQKNIEERQRNFDAEVDEKINTHTEQLARKTLTREMKESGYNRAERKLVMESLKENSLRQLGNAALQLEVVDTKQSSLRAEYQQVTDRALSLQKRSERLKSTLLENSERRSSADTKIQQLEELERDWKTLEKERNNGADSTLLPELDFRGYEAIGDLLGDIENQKMRLKHLIAERDKIEKAIDDTNSHIEKTKKENTSLFHRLAPRSAQLEAQRDEIQRKIRSMVRDINNGK